MKEFFVPFLAIPWILISSVLELNQLVLLWLLSNRCLGKECMCEISELCEYRSALSFQQDCGRQESVLPGQLCCWCSTVSQGFCQEGVQHQLEQLWDVCC